MSVKVGVRVRPFNGREMELNCRLCVDMVGVTTKLLDLEDAKRNRDFSFDYSFWSHDCFEPNASGYFEYIFDNVEPHQPNMLIKC